MCFHTAPCCFNLSWAPPGLTRKGITTDLGYTCPKGCVSVNVCVNARMPVGVLALHSLANLTRISSVFFFHQFSNGSPNMSEIKSGQAAPCADVWLPKLHPTHRVWRPLQPSLNKGVLPCPYTRPNFPLTHCSNPPQFGSGSGAWTLRTPLNRTLHSSDKRRPPPELWSGRKNPHTASASHTHMQRCFLGKYRIQS